MDVCRVTRQDLLVTSPDQLGPGATPIYFSSSYHQRATPAAELPQPLERMLSEDATKKTLEWAARHVRHRRNTDMSRYTRNLEVSKATSGDKSYLSVATPPSWGNLANHENPSPHGSRTTYFRA